MKLHNYKTYNEGILDFKKSDPIRDFVKSAEQTVAYEIKDGIINANHLTFTKKDLLYPLGKVNILQLGGNFKTIENLPKECESLTLVKNDMTDFSWIKNIKGLTNLQLYDCVNFTDLSLIPNTVESAYICRCGVENLIGLPKSVEFISLDDSKKLTSLEGASSDVRINARDTSIKTKPSNLDFKKLDIVGTPLFHLISYISNLTRDNKRMSNSEIYDRLEEFEVIKDNEIDIISLNSLCDFLGTSLIKIKGWDL